MDLAAAAGKTPESDPDSSTRIHTPKPVSFSNGVLKRNHHSGLHNNNNNHHHRGVGGEGGGVVYKECLKNHAASLGAHAVDGCGEFMPSPTANSADPTSLKCAACGCHRNFHRREPEDSFHHTTTTPALEYQPHHRHHPPNPPPPPPPPPGDGGGGGGSHSSPSSPSPPPISSSYYPSAPHLLLTLSGGGGGGIPAAVAAGTSSHSPVDHHHHHLTPIGNRTSPVTNGRKRFRTRFTQDQKGKMLGFAEKLEWKMQKRDEELIIRFCNEIGVEKGVFKVWMHNNKNIFGKRGEHSTSNNNNPIPIGGENLNMAFLQNHQQQQNQEIQNEEEESGNHFNGDNNFNGRVVCPNGSSSSS